MNGSHYSATKSNSQRSSLNLCPVFLKWFLWNKLKWGNPEGFVSKTGRKDFLQHGNFLKFQRQFSWLLGHVWSYYVKTFKRGLLSLLFLFHAFTFQDWLPVERFSFLNIQLLFIAMNEWARTHQQQTMRLKEFSFKQNLWRYKIPLLDFVAMESTLALISANISLSLFAKPQLLFTTRLCFGLVAAGLMLEFCGLALDKAVSIKTQRNSAKLAGRENTGA